MVAFAFGREDLIPLIFTGLLRYMNQGMKGALDPFIVYLERHIEVDGEDHGPMSMMMIAELCGDNHDPRWEEATAAAEKALQVRIRLWDGVVQQLAKKDNKQKEVVTLSLLSDLRPLVVLTLVRKGQ